MQFVVVDSSSSSRIGHSRHACRAHCSCRSISSGCKSHCIMQHVLPQEIRQVAVITLAQQALAQKALDSAAPPPRWVCTIITIAVVVAAVAAVCCIQTTAGTSTPHNGGDEYAAAVHHNHSLRCSPIHRQQRRLCCCCWLLLLSRGECALEKRALHNMAGGRRISETKRNETG